MLFKGRKNREEFRSWEKVAFALLFVSFSPFAFSQGSKHVGIEAVQGNDITVDALLEMALDPSHPDYEPEEYVTREPETPSPKHATPDIHAEFHDLATLTHQEDRTFGSLIQDAELELNNYLAAQPAVQDAYAQEMDSALRSKRPVQAGQVTRPDSNVRVDESTPEQPASPLSTLLADRAVVLPAQVKGQGSAVKITVDKDKVNVSSPELKVSLGEQIPFLIQQLKGSGSLGIFVRDGSVVNWNAKDQILTAQQEGQTELYLHYENQLLILPVKVGAAENRLQIPKELTVLNDVSEPKNLLASLDDVLDRANHAKKHLVPLAESKTSIEEDKTSPVNNDERKDSRALATNSFEFAIDEKNYETEKINFRVVDDRTHDKKTYPVAGVQVHLVGSSFTQQTDSLGLVNGVEVPRSSSFVVSVKDPFQRYRASIVELPSSMIEDNKTVVIRLLQQETFDAYSSITVDENHENHSSICATVNGKDGQPLVGAVVSMDWGNSRPYYFNHFGYLDPTADKTSDEGRFCIFDLEPGPFAFYFKKANGEQEGPVPLNLFAGSHIEHRFDIENSFVVNTALAAAPTAFELWHGGRITEKEFRPIDYASLSPLGSTEELDYNNETMTLTGKQSFYQGRAYNLSKSSEFEETLYRVDLGDEAEEVVTPLFPNGFLDDISAYSNVIRDFNKGTVLVDHGSLLGENELANKTIEVSMVDQNERPVGERISLNTGNTSAAVFFNVPPGVYTITVKASDGAGIWNDTVLVYSNTLSYMRTGSPLVRVNSPDSSQVAQY